MSIGEEFVHIPRVSRSPNSELSHVSPFNSLPCSASPQPATCLEIELQGRHKTQLSPERSLPRATLSVSLSARSREDHAYPLPQHSFVDAQDLPDPRRVQEVETSAVEGICEAHQNACRLARTFWAWRYYTRHKWWARGHQLAVSRGLATPSYQPCGCCSLSCKHRSKRKHTATSDQRKHRAQALLSLRLCFSAWHRVAQDGQRAVRMLQRMATRLDTRLLQRCFTVWWRKAHQKQVVVVRRSGISKVTEQRIARRSISASPSAERGSLARAAQREKRRGPMVDAGAQTTAVRHNVSNVLVGVKQRRRSQLWWAFSTWRSFQQQRALEDDNSSLQQKMDSEVSSLEQALQKSKKKISKIRSRCLKSAKLLHNSKVRFWAFTLWRAALDARRATHNAVQHRRDTTESCLVEFASTRGVKQKVFSAWRKHRRDEAHARRVGSALTRAACELNNALRLHARLRASRGVMCGMVCSFFDIFLLHRVLRVWKEQVTAKKTHFQTTELQHHLAVAQDSAARAHAVLRLHEQNLRRSEQRAINTSITDAIASREIVSGQRAVVRQAFDRWQFNVAVEKRLRPEITSLSQDNLRMTGALMRARGERAEACGKVVELAERRGELAVLGRFFACWRCVLVWSGLF